MFLIANDTTMLLIWFGIIIIAAVIEASTMNLSSIWFSAGGVVSLIIAAIWPGSVFIQIVVFLVVSSLLLFEVRPTFKNYLQKNDIKTNSDKLIGKIAICSKAFANGERGEVKIEGKIWTAISNEEIKLNDKVEVLSIEGVKLVVRKPE
ncbi:MAG: NfeD family protein [Candidatus Izemoplasmatales bacterium]|jgi:membrane protein implicated in regulation of membrane protease activity|nr:NfeD family protein [Candidatus Izemoplasmatales bacterium]